MENNKQENVHEVSECCPDDHEEQDIQEDKVRALRQNLPESSHVGRHKTETLPKSGLSSFSGQSLREENPKPLHEFRILHFEDSFRSKGNSCTNF